MRTGSHLAQRGVHLRTFHEPSEGVGAGRGDWQRELVDSHSIGDSEPVDAFVRRLPSQQLPQQYAVAGGRGGTTRGGRGRTGGGRLEVKPG